MIASTSSSPRPVRRPSWPITAVTLLLALSFAAPDGAAAQNRGFYVSAKLGSTDVEQSFGDTVDQLVDGDEDSVAFEAGFRFGRYLAVQAGYHDFGSIPGLICEPRCEDAPGPVAELEAETKAYSLSVVPQLGLPFGFSIFGKAGVVFWESEVDVVLDDGGSEFVDDFSDEDLIYGLGARFELPGPFSIFAEWEEIAGDIETISLGATLRF